MLGSPTDGASKPEAQQNLTVPMAATQTNQNNVNYENVKNI
jgi:hypothetical protein